MFQVVVNVKFLFSSCVFKGLVKLKVTQPLKFMKKLYFYLYSVLGLALFAVGGRMEDRIWRLFCNISLRFPGIAEGMAGHCCGSGQVFLGISMEECEQSHVNCLFFLY